MVGSGGWVRPAVSSAIFHSDLTDRALICLALKKCQAVFFIFSLFFALNFLHLIFDENASVIPTIVSFW